MYQIPEVCFYSDIWQNWDWPFHPSPAPTTSMKTTCSWETLTNEIMLPRQREQWGLWGVLCTPNSRPYSKSYSNLAYHREGDCTSHEVLGFHKQIGMCCLFPFLQILTKIPNTQFSNILPQLPRDINQANVSPIIVTRRKSWKLPNRKNQKSFVYLWLDLNARSTIISHLMHPLHRLWAAHEPCPLSSSAKRFLNLTSDLKTGGRQTEVWEIQHSCGEWKQPTSAKAQHPLCTGERSREVSCKSSSSCLSHFVTSSSHISFWLYCC